MSAKESHVRAGCHVPQTDGTVFEQDGFITGHGPYEFRDHEGATHYGRLAFLFLTLAQAKRADARRRANPTLVDEESLDDVREELTSWSETRIDRAIVLAAGIG